MNVLILNLKEIGMSALSKLLKTLNALNFLIREGAATVGNDFKPPISSPPGLVLNANYISRFLAYLTPPKT